MKSGCPTAGLAVIVEIVHTDRVASYRATSKRESQDISLELEPMLINGEITPVLVSPKVIIGILYFRTHLVG